MEKFMIERIRPMHGDWMHFDLILIVSKDDAKKTKRVMVKRGAWRMIKAVRTKFRISFDGKRFSDGDSMKSLKKKFPDNVVRYQLSRCREIYRKFMAIDPDAE